MLICQCQIKLTVDTCTGNYTLDLSLQMHQCGTLTMMLNDLNVHLFQLMGKKRDVRPHANQIWFESATQHFYFVAFLHLAGSLDLRRCWQSLHHRALGPVPRLELRVMSWPQPPSVCYVMHLSYDMTLYTVGWTRLVAAGRPGRRHLDWEPQLGARWQQDSDAGQRRPHPDGTELQDHLWSGQHWQRVSGHGLEERNGLHE